MKKYEKNTRILKPVLPTTGMRGEKITRNSRIEIVVSLPYYLPDDRKKANKGGDNRILSGNSSERTRKILDLYGYMNISYINAIFSDVPYRGIRQYFCEFDTDEPVPDENLKTTYHGKLLKKDASILVKKYLYEIFSLKPRFVLCSGDIFYWLYKGVDPIKEYRKGVHEFRMENIHFFYLIVHNVYENFDMFCQDLKRWRNVLPAVVMDDYKDLLMDMITSYQQNS